MLLTKAFRLAYVLKHENNASCTGTSGMVTGLNGLLIISVSSTKYKKKIVRLYNYKGLQ